MGHIVDISKWNGNINWDVAAPQLDLAICRVQYGSKKVDEWYQRYVAKLEECGVPHAAYAYGCYVSVNDAVVEADDFMSRTSPNAKFLVLDVEDDTLQSCGANNLAAASQAFIDRCKSKGWKIGLYLSHHMYENYGLSGLKADFLWIPRYGGNKPKYACDIWQYTETGNVPGIGKCDLNYLQGVKTLNWYIGTTQKATNYQIHIGDFDELTWAGDSKREIKEYLEVYGVWDIRLEKNAYRLVVGDFNDESWCNETLNKLKERFPGYGMWKVEI
jgi:GH25 family lysozyme M1 (1,4-beta-N-acetylmuramidase)